jgi:cation:H+ antiporter
MIDFLYDFIKEQSTGLQWLFFIIATVLGFIILVKCADIFVDSASNIAHIFKIPAILVGLTIVAFGTSAPELSISVMAASSGSDGIAIGNISGSVIFNLYFVLAVSSLIAPVAIKRYLVKRDLLVMTVSSLLLVMFAFLFSTTGNPALIWIEGLIFLVIFVIYLIVMIRREIKYSKVKMHVVSEEYAAEELKTSKNQKNGWISFLLLVISLLGIVIGGALVNIGARGIVVNIGASENLAGLTVCALGSSLPELVTSLVAMKKNENDIAIGNIVGSNLFNILLILGVCSLVAPQTLSTFALIDIVIMAIMCVVFMVYAIFNSKLGKKMAISMITIYTLFFIFIVLREYVPIL